MLLKEEQLDNYEKALSNYWRKQGEDRKKQWITNFFKAHGTTYEEEKEKALQVPLIHMILHGDAKRNCVRKSS